ncbi:LacI family transcriptional regulator [Corynebacterium atypicum]|uniref:LacI family transcriptional regulator n=1 Tax=Corynebacterium atypicum TaxID=191610 RepID=A0ABM5QPB2_9CORY|nr:LacI family DNA-binding transcriptional regulator [Corynebacterium atypicum]AIG64664.1 LacI family transcriptional regulator [Corynebacterium atypicum]
MPRRNKSRPTLATVAAELGVSRTTVSNAYNHPEQLSPVLRRKILAKARALGYPGPNPAARSLRTRRTGAIGVVLTEHLTYAFEDDASVDFLAGVAEATSGTQTSLTLIPVGPDATSPTAPVAAAVVDGFIVYSVAHNDPYLKAALARGLPVVICGQPRAVPGADFVGLDEREAIKPAARALLARGHRSIGVLAIRLLSRPTTGPVDAAALKAAALHIQRDRILGILDECQDAGIDPSTVPVVTTHINDPANARRAAEQLLTQHPEITAVACTTDSMALGVLDYASARGIRIPEDLSVTGFDGVGRALAEGLTTIIQPNVRKGQVAAALLDAAVSAQLAGTPREKSRVILPTEFHPGRTVAAAR